MHFLVPAVFSGEFSTTDTESLADGHGHDHGHDHGHGHGHGHDHGHGHGHRLLGESKGHRDHGPSRGRVRRHAGGPIRGVGALPSGDSRRRQAPKATATKNLLTPWS